MCTHARTHAHSTKCARSCRHAHGIGILYITVRCTPDKLLVMCACTCFYIPCQFTSICNLAGILKRSLQYNAFGRTCISDYTAICVIRLSTSNPIIYAIDWSASICSQSGVLPPESHALAVLPDAFRIPEPSRGVEACDVGVLHRQLGTYLFLFCTSTSQSMIANFNNGARRVR